MDMEPLKSSEEPGAAGTERGYEPPAVAWEEPFDSVAASGSLDPDCQQNWHPGCP
jgi:hypothetical protein